MVTFDVTPAPTVPVTNTHSANFWSTTATGDLTYSGDWTGGSLALDLSGAAPFVTESFVGIAAGASISSAANLTIVGTYTWTITASTAGCTDALTTVTFDVVAAPTPDPIVGLTTPPGGPASYTDTLSWTATVPDVGYEIQLFDDSCNGTLVAGWPKTTARSHFS